MTRDEIVALLDATADQFRIPRLLLLACCCAESGLNPLARRPTTASQDQAYWTDVSGGLAQQTVRWDPAYRGGPGYPGPAEIERVLSLQYDPERSANVAAVNLKGRYFSDEDDAIFKALCRYNMPGGHGQPANADVAENYRRGIADATAILGGQPMPTVVFDPSTPIDQQQHDWDCAEQSAGWGITALGRHPSDAWLEQQMLADGIESRDVGLLDGSGAQLAGWITRQYSNATEGTPTLKASNATNVSFDDVRSLAGMTSVLIGGHHWGNAGHWSGVRDYDSTNDVLVLANPATGYDGIGATMSRQEFARVSPCSMVVIRADGAVPVPVPVPPPTPPVDPRDAQIADLKRQLAAARSALGVASVDYVRGLRDLADALERLKPAS